MASRTTQVDADRLARFNAFRKANPQVGSPFAIAREIGASETAVRRLLRNEPVELPKIGVRVSGTECDVVTANPCSLDDMLRVCKVDLTVWRVGKHVVNKWEVGVKQKDGSVIRSPLFQIKAWLERIPGADLAATLRETIREISEGARLPKAPAVCKRRAVDDPHCLEVSLPDIHNGKLTWAPEVGESYDVKIAPSLAMEAAAGLWAKASVFPITRILLPIGNDYFNVNNAAGTTAGGTPQDEDGRWKRTFKIGIKLAVDLIEYFRGKTVDGVDVMLVPGNHDPERLYYLGCVLEGIYKDVKDVRINNGAMARKYFRFGTTLLGFTHGHGEKHDKLPLIMAGERPRDWAETTHHEFHLGHLHHMRETRYHAGQEFGPVRVRILPSLCPADEWHFTSGYVGSKRAAEAYLWSFKHGYTGHLSWSP